MTKAKETKVTATAPVGEPINLVTGEPVVAPSVAPASASVPTIDYDAIATKVSEKVLPGIKDAISGATKAVDDLIVAPPITAATPIIELKKERDMFGFELH